MAITHPFHLTQRGVLCVAGADRQAFLQGLISNDITRCTPQASLYAALLTPQGKFLHDFFIYDAGDFFLIDCESDRADDLLQRLRAYKLRAKVTVEDMSDAYEVWIFPEGSEGLVDPRLSTLGNRGVIRKSSPPLADLMQRHQIENERELINKSLYVDEPPPAPPASGVGAYDHLRLTLGIADGSRDMEVGKSTLLDGNFDFLNGISWTKGCYVGQELTARMHHRDLVKKRLFPVRIDGTPPPFGAIIRQGGQEVGVMRSHNDTIGLALLNVEAAKQAIQTSTGLACETASLSPYLPDWMKTTF